jgi:hypothetical protein
LDSYRCFPVDCHFLPFLVVFLGLPLPSKEADCFSSLSFRSGVGILPDMGLMASIGGAELTTGLVCNKCGCVVEVFGIGAEDFWSASEAGIQFPLTITYFLFLMSSTLWVPLRDRIS